MARSNISMPRTTAGNRFTAKDFVTSLSFAGGAATDNVQFTDSGSLDLTSTMTIMAWINPNSFGTSNAGRIVCKNTGTQGYELLFDGANSTLRAFMSSTLYPSSQTGTITLKVWQHVAMTFNSAAGSNEIKFYVNGVAAGTATRNTAVLATTTNLVIGNNVSSSLNRAFDGLIDEVKIYSRALGADEVLAEFYGTNENTNGLVMYSKFDEGSGTSAIDTSETQANGTITGATYSTNVVRRGRTVAGTRTVVT